MQSHRTRTLPGLPLPATTLSALLAALVLGGCLTPREAREGADREVYQVLTGLRDGLARGEDFTIEQPERSLRDRILAGEEKLAPLTLEESLRIAGENSREFQSRKEDLYLAALDLTLARWDFSVRETGTFGAFLAGARNAPTTTGETASYGFQKLFTTGLSVLGDFSIGLAKDVSNGNPWKAITNANLSITQPLLRGFGSDVVREPLTQAERNVIYQARAYDRFRRTFAYDVTSRFYRLLELQDVLENQRANRKGLELLRARNEAFAKAGRLNDIQVDQARQDELRARDRVIAAERTLDAALDNFKLFLGLPIDTPIELDPGDRLSLDAWRGLELDVPAEVAIDVALAERLDQRTARDRVQDAERRVRVAADQLRAGLDLGVDLSAASKENALARYDPDSLRSTVSLDLDLPIDRLRERNAYRERLIEEDRARRDAVESEDALRVSVRDQQRRTRAALESYKIQTRAVSLAERRVESSQLNLEAGRASTRDVLEAQEALVTAQNAATSALTDAILTGLALYRDMELLRVDEGGLSLDTAPILERWTPE